MPFTVSHAVAVLPLARNRRLVPAALVIGSWVPDLPYFVPLLEGSDWTHAASGPVTVDLLLGVFVLAVWQLVLRRPLVDLAPVQLRERMPPPRRINANYLVGSVVSLVLGALTHVVWDTFTHPGRWGTTHLPALAEGLGPLPVYKWLQFASGALGLLGLLAWVLLWLRRTPRRHSTSRVGPVVRHWAWLAIVALALGVAGATTASGWLAGRSLEGTAFRAVTRSIGATGAAVILVSLLWLLRNRRKLR